MLQGIKKLGQKNAPRYIRLIEETIPFCQRMEMKFNRLTALEIIA